MRLEASVGLSSSHEDAMRFFESYLDAAEPAPCDPTSPQTSDGSSDSAPPSHSRREICEAPTRSGRGSRASGDDRSPQRAPSRDARALSPIGAPNEPSRACRLSPAQPAPARQSLRGPFARHTQGSPRKPAERHAGSAAAPISMVKTNLLGLGIRAERIPSHHVRPCARRRLLLGPACGTELGATRTSVWADEFAETSLPRNRRGERVNEHDLGDARSNDPWEIRAELSEHAAA
jgi:hypothetical protein